MWENPVMWLSEWIKEKKKNVITMTISVTFIMQEFVPYDDAFMLD